MTASASSAPAPSARRPGPRRAGRRATVQQRQPLERPLRARGTRATNSFAGSREQVGGRPVLLEHPADVEDGDAVAQLDGLVDVVGDEHDRLAHASLEGEQLVLQAGPHDGVDRAEGLVHQQDGRVGGEGPGHADPLLLATRQLRRVALEHLGVEADEVGQLARPGRRCAPCPSRAAAARWRCCRRRCGAGTGRSAGSRSRCRGAARAPASARIVDARRPRCGRPSARSRRLIILSVVVLPQPDGPTSTATLPPGMSSVRSLDGGAGVAARGWAVRMGCHGSPRPRMAAWVVSRGDA